MLCGSSTYTRIVLAVCPQENWGRDGTNREFSGLGTGFWAHFARTPELAGLAISENLSIRDALATCVMLSAGT
jgi:hypothetical protein